MAATFDQCFIEASASLSLVMNSASVNMPLRYRSSSESMVDL